MPHLGDRILFIFPLNWYSTKETLKWYAHFFFAPSYLSADSNRHTYFTSCLLAFNAQVVGKFCESSRPEFWNVHIPGLALNSNFYGNCFISYAENGPAGFGKYIEGGVSPS